MFVGHFKLTSWPLQRCSVMGNKCFGISSKIQNSRSCQSATDSSTAKDDSSLSPLSSFASSSNHSTFILPLCGLTNNRLLPHPEAESEILSCSNVKAFTYSELRKATKNFHANCLLGEGGFGCVYKGWIKGQSLVASKPGSGTVVAIKKLKHDGEQGHKEWLTEVHYLRQFRHPNLVKLIGCCSEGDDRLLVYEFMPKGSLENHLFRRGARTLSWGTRIKIAVGAARGLSFLHDAESQVIYRDVKSSNILLDAEFNAKLSDFGLARAGPTGDKTHISTQVLGTYGYAAPEYIATGRLTAKADVYSFGVVLVEMISGRRAVEQNIADWARTCWGDGRSLFRIMDSELEGRYPREGALTVATLALLCIDNEASIRPRMSDVVKTLEQLHNSAEMFKPSQSNRFDGPSSTGKHSLRSLSRKRRSNSSMHQIPQMRRSRSVQ